MLKAVISPRPGKDGRETLCLGLTFANLDRLRAAPLDTFIRVNGAELGLPVDVVIFSGQTEAHLAQLLADVGGIGPETKVVVSDKLKS